MARIVKESIDRFYDYDIYPETRTLYIGSVSILGGEESGVDAHMAERAIKGLHILDSSSDKPIRIIMNNPGGDKYHGLAIYDAVKACKNHVTITIYGHVMSMGSIILQAADTRIMSANSRMMVHYGTWGAQGIPKVVYSWIEEGKKYDKIMEDIYLESIKKIKPRFSREEVKALLDTDTILNAQECIDLGLCDKIL